MKKIKLFILKIICKIFYKNEYLHGRWFDNCIDGWKVAFRQIIPHKILGYNKQIPWPVSHLIRISKPENIIFDLNDLQNFWTFGCYFQNIEGKIYIGKGTYIAPNVGIITSNHNIDDLKKHKNGEDVIIGENCWIGMNSVILPGVILGNHTVVGAGSVVTKSFEDGNCVIAGNPAKRIERINLEPKRLNI